MAALYEMQDVEFKPRAYEHASESIRSLTKDIADVYHEGGEKALDAISGIGAGIAEHVRELLTTGHFKEYETMHKKAPVNMLELTSVEGIGPKTVKILWEELKIKNIDDLERAIKNGKLEKVAGFGWHSVEKIEKGIEFYRQSRGRFVLGFIMPDVQKFAQEIRRFQGVGIERVAVAGSVRRWKETIGDIDVLVVARDAAACMKRVTSLEEVAYVYSTGTTKTNVRLRSGIDVDIRVVPTESWGAALNYFTGSKPHNIALRKIALEKGYKLNEYGLFKGEKQIAGRTEEDLYKALGLRYIESELREMTGEIKAAQAGKLPELVGYDALHGDLQVQTRATDGNSSIEAMADAAESAGLEYIAITDHTRSLAMTHGLDESGLLKQAREIDKINAKRKAEKKKLVVLKGAEVNIMKDGSLDISNDALAKLDVVGAAVHSHFTLSKKEQTARIIRAMENPNVDIIFHLTGRLLNKRESMDIDIDEIIAAAKRTKTILEIDAFPDRLDIKDTYIRKCVEAGVWMCVDSDAHAPEHFQFLKYGIAQARRGWAERGDIINTFSLKQFLKKLK